MRIIYIAHPIGGDIEGNLKKINDIVNYLNSISDDIVPFVPYYADCVACDDNDPEQRNRCILNDREHFIRRNFDELWLYGDKVSSVMKAEIELAIECNIPIQAKTQATFKWLNENLTIGCKLNRYYHNESAPK